MSKSAHAIARFFGVGIPRRREPPPPLVGSIILPKQPSEWSYTPPPPPPTLCELVKERDAALARAEKAEATIDATWSVINAGHIGVFVGTLPQAVSYFVSRSADLEQRCEGLRSALRGMHAGIKEALDGRPL